MYVIYLPAHMSSRMQPADTALNALLKAILRRLFHKLLSEMLHLEMNLAYINWVPRVFRPHAGRSVAACKRHVRRQSSALCERRSTATLACTVRARRARSAADCSYTRARR